MKTMLDKDKLSCSVYRSRSGTDLMNITISQFYSTMSLMDFWQTQMKDWIRLAYVRGISSESNSSPDVS
jgi:hypothetical protein